MLERVVPESNGWCLCKRKEEVQTHTQRQPRAGRGRDWRDVSTSQRTSRTAGKHQKLGEAWTDPPSRAFGGDTALLTP